MNYSHTYSYTVGKLTGKDGRMLVMLSNVKQTLFTKLTHVYALHAVAGSLCEHGAVTKRHV